MLIPRNPMRKIVMSSCVSLVERFNFVGFPWIVYQHPASLQTYYLPSRQPTPIHSRITILTHTDHRQTPYDPYLNYTSHDSLERPQPATHRHSSLGCHPTWHSCLCHVILACHTDNPTTLLPSAKAAIIISIVLVEIPDEQSAATASQRSARR